MPISSPQEEISTDKSETQQNLCSNNLTDQYVISIHAILWHHDKIDNQKPFFMLEIENLASKSIMSALDDIREKWDNKTVWLEWDNGSFIIDENDSNNPDDVYKYYQKRLKESCNIAKFVWKIPVIGFSSMGWYELLPRLSKIIKELKKEHKNLICIIWWADFNALPDEVFLNQVFDYWIDIVNIWWASEFVDFFWKLSNTDSFYRDKDGLLRIMTEREVPQNLIFAHQKGEIWEIKPGKKINTTFYYNSLGNALHFSINNNSCLNNCHYCANYIHDNIPLKDCDIDNAITDCNKYISIIENDKISLDIDDPNPFQYVDKFERFLKSLDLSKIKEIAFFGDFMWMGNFETYNKVTKIIDHLLEKWPNLTIHIWFSMDAFHHKDDWEFIWRTVWSKIAEEHKYIEWFKYFNLFHDKYINNPRIYIPFNTIFHPNMKLADYVERYDFIIQHAWQNTCVWMYPLAPYINTQLERDHRWYFIPEFEVINIVDPLSSEFKGLNLWWHFYLNSNFLDCFVLSRWIWLDGMFEDIVNHKFENDEAKNDFNEKIFFYFLCFWCWKKIERLYKKANSILWRIQFKKRDEILKKVRELINFTIGYIDFMIYREYYISRINPSYKTQKLDKFLHDLESIRIEFLKLK
ncbi:MAG: hypothetical protein ACD_3C00154G0004 [uncultured bacterium (gcode 4)]|uniref:Radical SAM protein n=1 Tax=uncultured bacterium (gcode 4) TaxID=1234023 RepID=K2F9G9_9BACT|nr:MAG: hypothetical protein ACD_3C00154G0004 [uncultured bacterium (gcode 4)]